MLVAAAFIVRLFHLPQVLLLLGRQPVEVFLACHIDILRRAFSGQNDDAMDEVSDFAFRGIGRAVNQRVFAKGHSAGVIALWGNRNVIPQSDAAVGGQAHGAAALWHACGTDDETLNPADVPFIVLLIVWLGRCARILLRSRAGERQNSHRHRDEADCNRQATRAA